MLLLEESMKRLGWILVTVLLLYCCNGGTQPDQLRRAPGTTNQNQIVIQYGRQVNAADENLTIEFLAVLEDSRCPAGVQCVWEGNARIELAVSRVGEERSTLELNTSDRFAVEGRYLDYIIALIDLKPYPKATEQISMQDYTAIVEIRKP
jgi:hypothetical protein